MNIWWARLDYGGCPSIPDDVLMDCDPRIAIHILLGDYKFHYVELYEVKVLEKVGKWDHNLKPIPFPGFPVKNSGFHAYTIEKENSWDLGVPSSHKFGYAYIDVANCEKVHTFPTLEEAKESVARYKHKKYLILKILYEVKVKWKNTNVKS